MEHTPEQDAAIKDIRDKMVAGCSVDQFSGMRCPVCGSGLELDVHPRGKMVFVRCVSDTTHVAFHAVARNAPTWWAAHRSGGWLSDAETAAAVDGGV